MAYSGLTLVCAFCLAASQFTLATEAEDVHPYLENGFSLDLLSADVGDYDGVMVKVSLGVNCQAFKYVGIGLNYNYLELDINVDKSSWRGNIETTYDDLFLYASFYSW